MMNKETIETLLEQMRKLPPTKDMSEEDKVVYSKISKAIMGTELTRLIEEKEWVLGIIMSASMLKFAGQVRLIWKYKGCISREKITNFSLATTNMVLFTSGIVNEDVYRKMEKVKDARNRIAHDLLSQLQSSREPNPEIEGNIQETISIIETLFQTQ